MGDPSFHLGDEKDQREYAEEIRDFFVGAAKDGLAVVVS
jgi:hypothetical protein